MNDTVSPKIYEVLKRAVNGNIESFEISVEAPNKKGEGFLGQIFFVSLHNKNNGKQLNFVVKQAFSDQSIRDLQPIRDVFLNEIYFYKTLWPKMSAFQERVPQKQRFEQLAKYFAAVSEENYERLVLENLKYQGFVMHEKQRPLDQDMMEFIFEVYGKFHAISFAYKALDPEGYSDLTKGAVDIWDKMSRLESFQKSVNLSLEACLDCFEPGDDDEIIEKYGHCVKNGVELFTKSLVEGQNSCIIHGDCWSNNMMFKYDNTGKLVDLRFLDFQIVRVGSPVCDLSYCLYSGGTKKTFDELDHLLQVYHGSLSESLKAYGCDPDEIYPLNALRNDWKVHCQLGMIMGLMIWRGKLIYDDDMIDLTDVSEKEGDVAMFFAAKYDEKAFRERTRDIIFHLYENDYML